MIYKIVLTIVIFSSVIYADSWECRNDIEIRCADGKCAAETKSGFTPMSVRFNDSGKMTVCAYTGCWEATGRVVNNQNFMSLTATNLKFSTAPNSKRQNIAIMLDRNDGVATLKAGDFAHPIICKSSNPKFSDHTVRVSSAKPKPVSFRGNKDARMFRTRLKAAQTEGMNFAGHFIFTSWGCGTSCLYGAIINTKTGRVYFPKELKGVSFGMGMDIPDQPLQYRKDSKLFILHGNAAYAEKPGVTYLVWEGTRFRQIKFTPGKSNF